MIKNKKNPLYKKYGLFLICSLLLLISTGCHNIIHEMDGYPLIKVDGGDLSPTRLPNVVVDIGFGDRAYYSFTNEYAQVVKVIADKIILQDDSKEPVKADGRYYLDQADLVPCDLSGFDNGHIIADCLGGVANAYNITPQNSTLNQHGDQAYMERMIRYAGGCTDFVGLITYDDASTMIPCGYTFTFNINGEDVAPFEFANINPEMNLLDETLLENAEDISPLVDRATDKRKNKVDIINLDKKAEYVIIKNNGDSKVNLKGWCLLSVCGHQEYTFKRVILKPSETLKIGDAENNLDVDIHWFVGGGVWNNQQDDDAELYDKRNNLVFRYDG